MTWKCGQAFRLSGLSARVCIRTARSSRRPVSSHPPSTVLFSSIYCTTTKMISLLYLFLLASVTGCHAHSPKIASIIARAHRGASPSDRSFCCGWRLTWYLDGIDLPSLPFAEAAFASIKAIGRTDATQLDFGNATRVDTHGQHLCSSLSVIHKVISLA